MNLVRLQYGGGSSIEPYTVIVSLDEEFKGQSVTLTQGTEIMHKTCPMTSPYEVTFKPMKDGVWVASSTTKDGKVVSVNTEPLLEWGTYNVTLESGFNFQEWLNRGRVEKTFTSLDDILADEPTVRQLMTVHDSVDYLVTALSNYADTAEKILDNDICAKWINLRDYALDMLYANANVKAVMDSVDKYGYGEWALIDGTWQPKGAVPVMTSNTAPYGEVLASSVFTNYDKFKVFDDVDSTYWASNNQSSSVGEYIGYKFVNPICVQKVKCRLYANALTFDVYGSNDNSKWDKLDSINATTTSTDFNINNDKFYLYYKLQCVTEISNMIGIYTLQFYGRELNVSVPKMDNYTTPFGEVIELGYVTSGYEGYRAFDNNLSTYWQSNTNYIGMVCYNFEKEVLVKNMHSIMKSPNTGVSKLEGSNTGNSNDWHPIYSDNITAGYPNTKSVPINGNLAYKYYRATITRTDDVPQLTELQFYGLDYSEREFAEGSTMKYLYDHGVELETITTTSMVTKRASELFINQTAAGTAACVHRGIDLTPYKLIRAKTGTELVLGSSDTAFGTISVIEADAQISVSTPRIYNNITLSTVPHNSYLDISSVNAIKDLLVEYNSRNTRNNKLTITEWWLE